MIIKNIIRKSDIAIRIGGEEFLVLMPGTSKDGAFETAERIRSAIESNNNIIVGKQTISIGVGERMKYESFINWYRRVDEALYNAKQTGRNRVVASEKLEYTINTPMEWKDRWESGNKEIDRQHKEIIDIGNQFKDSVLDSKNQEDVYNLFRELLNKFSYNFDFRKNSSL